MDGGKRFSWRLQKSNQLPWKLLHHPAVNLISVGKDPGSGSAIHPVNGKAELNFPALVGRDRALKVGGDLLPGFEDFLLFQSSPPRAAQAYIILPVQEDSKISQNPC